MFGRGFVPALQEVSLGSQESLKTNLSFYLHHRWDPIIVCGLHIYAGAIQCSLQILLLDSFTRGRSRQAESVLSSRQQSVQLSCQATI